ncbi:MAG TPA: hypothetical protein VIF09_29575, partial [Polyangiaceae bacterium]
MQRSVRVVVLAIGSAGSAAAVVASCGGSASHASGGGDAGGAETSPAGEGAAPESGADAPADHAADVSDAGVEAAVIPGTNFAFRHYYLGDTDRAGVFGATAWKLYGTNVDGKVTTTTSTDVCTLAAGAAKATQADGPGGIDNSWGANLMPLFMTI